MNKKQTNEIYLLIAAAIIAVVTFDTLLEFHPWGNFVGAGLLLVACYRIGQHNSKK